MQQRKASKKWLLTFPQLNELMPEKPSWSLEHFLDYMKEGLPNNPVVKACVCHEDHEDKGDSDEGCGVHPHIAFELTVKWWMPATMDFFDGLFGKHGRYETCRNWMKTIRYLCAPQEKNNMNPQYATFNIDVDAVLLALGTKKSYGFYEAANALWKENKTIKEVHDENPGFFAREKRKLEEYNVYVRRRKFEEGQKLHFPGFMDVPDGPRNETWEREQWQIIIDWCNLNFADGHVRQRRQKQLWIHGPKGIGKSTPFDETIKPFRKPYPWNYDNRQDEGLQACDFVLMDEMNGGVTLSFFKLFSQMSGTAKITFRYGTLETFERNIPLVVISNVHPDDIYVNAKLEDKEAIKDRFIFANPQYPYYMLLKQELPQPLPLPQQPLPLPQLPREDSDEDHSEHSNEERSKRRRIVPVQDDDSEISEGSFELAELQPISPIHCDTSQDYNNIDSEYLEELNNWDGEDLR